MKNILTDITEEELRNVVKTLRKHQAKTPFGVLSHKQGHGWVDTSFFSALFTRIKWFFGYE